MKIVLGVLAVLYVLALISAAPAASAEPFALAGHWEGAVVRLGAVQTIQVDFRQEGDRWTAAVDVPERGLFAMPAEEVKYQHPSLQLKLLYGDAALQVDAETEEITGLIEAWEPDVRVHLKRAEAPPPAVREEAVRFASGGLSLNGTVVLPLAAGPHPAVVLVHGSGPAGRSDGRYRSYGTFYARHGIAALVYDKRPGYENATFDDLANDAAAGVRYLRGRGEVDPGRVGLAGFSQGGWLAPLAASRTEGVAFLILQVGPAVSVEEQELQRVRYGLADEGFAEEDVARATAYTKLVFNTAYRGGDWAKLAAATEKSKGEAWTEQVELVVAPEDLEGWRRQRYDPAAVLKQTRIPVLALFGGRDTVVPPSENAELMARYLAEAGNRDVTIKVFPRANHSLEWYGELRQGSWRWPQGYWVWAKRAPGYAETVIGWLKARLGT